MVKVGIDALYVCSPEYYVDNAELAVARGSEPKHFTEGVGVRQFSLPPPNEDQSSMAATAAYRLLETYKVSPKEIFRIDTPTESGLDSSRALVSDVVGMLEQVYGTGSLSHVLGYEQKFACVSGMERYLDTSAWFAAGWNTSKYALIVATDIAKYDLKSREEPTQGAAAAAMLVAKDPRLLEIVPGAFGAALRNEKGDFKKPAGRTVALVDGARSYASYLSEMKLAWLNFNAAAVKAGMIKPSRDTAAIDSIDRAVYHNPHKKMVISAYASLLMHEWRSLPRWKEVAVALGPEPPREGMDDMAYYMSEAYGEFRRKFMRYKAFEDDFAKRVGSSLVAPEVVGNSYSVSVFVGLGSMFENDRDDLARKKVVLCGYGSGSHAVIQANVVPEGFKEVSKRFDLMARLGARKKLSIPDYERIHEGLVSPEDWPAPASKRFVLRSIGQEGTRAEGDRQYALAG
ncbi:MAG TPA: hydroxymethylglutaryl-CoA synthase [Nitrososphaerales archaeon]|nr:hydroxymethylglutaryl-CoA synthase [Nitrososphaerales archaeon]HUK75941.1 hydroxymethylglutaryl-CoA synthase [Nitrososphaerales archaeon]